MTKLDPRFTLSDIKLFDVNAERRSSTEEYHNGWQATFEEEPSNRARLVIATFHAGDEDAEMTVTAGALFVAASRSALTARGQDLADMIRHSLALETLYDVIRMHLRTLTGMLEIDLEVPYKSPSAEVRAFDKTANELGEGSPGEAAS